MPCKLCRFAYACMALRKDDMRIDKAKELTKRAIRDINNFIMAGSKDCALSTVLTFFKPILAALDENPLELEAASESRTDRLLDELADNMAKADEAMKPDKPLEQSEINHVVLDQIVRQQEELDRQADEIKRLKDFIKIEIDHAKAFKVLESEPEKSNTQMFINRAEEALERK